MSKSAEFPDVSSCVSCCESPHRLSSSSSQGVWSEEEHDRFLEAMRLFPKGPWKDITAHVGTRSVRQVQTHAQKYCEKLERRTRGLQKERKRLLRPEHRLDRASGGYVGGCSAVASGPIVSSALVFPCVRINTADADTCKSEQPQQEFHPECAFAAEESENEGVRERSECPDDDRNEALFSMADLDEQCLAYLARVLGVDDQGSF
ncbi:hypothetical protein Gpo141_00013850 [Globisporangium polare]